MQYLTPLSAALILQCSLTAFSQDKSPDLQYEVQEVIVSENSMVVKNNQDVFAQFVSIPESDAEEVKKNWERRIRNETKSKFVHHHHVTSLQSTLVKEVSSRPINVYFSCTQQDKAVKLNVAFELDTAFVSPTVFPDKCESAKAFLKQYGVERYKASVGEVLKAQKKKLRSVEGDMKKLFNEEKRLKSIIETRTLGIPHLENDLRENESAIKMKTSEITLKMEMVSKMAGEMKVEEQKKLDELKRARKKAQNEGKRITKKITRYKSDIQKAEHNVENNLSEQQLQKQRVEAQLQVVKNIEDKLNKIR